MPRRPPGCSPPPADPVPRRKQRTPELRARVLAAALDTLRDDGVAGLTTRAVARAAGTSTPAVYELFGDKDGLLCEVVFAGFRLLQVDLAALPRTDDPRADLVATLRTVRSFAAGQPVLSRLMFSRPVTALDPGPADRAAADSVRTLLVDRVRRLTTAMGRDIDPWDTAHVALALVHGLAAQEAAGWLGSTPMSTERRWALAVDTLLDGLAHLPENPDAVSPPPATPRGRSPRPSSPRSRRSSS